MQDFYGWLVDLRRRQSRVQETVCKNLVLDMHYEAQVQCVINYSAAKWGKKMTIAEARTYRLTQEQ
jgi:hypothetical protein